MCFYIHSLYVLYSIIHILFLIKEKFLILIDRTALLKCFLKAIIWKISLEWLHDILLLCNARLKVQVAGKKWTKSCATKSCLPMHYASRQNNKVTILWHAIKLPRHLFSVVAIVWFHVWSQNSPYEKNSF